MLLFLIIKTLWLSLFGIKHSPILIDIKRFMVSTFDLFQILLFFICVCNRLRCRIAFFNHRMVMPLFSHSYNSVFSLLFWILWTHQQHRSISFNGHTHTHTHGPFKCLQAYYMHNQLMKTIKCISIRNQWRKAKETK